MTGLDLGPKDHNDLSWHMIRFCRLTERFEVKGEDTLDDWEPGGLRVK
jgi:hypothetical protein